MPRQIVASVGFASAEPTKSAVVSGRQKQNLRAAWWPRRPRVANALSNAAKTGQSRPLSPPAPARSIPRPIFHFLGSSFLLARNRSSHRSSGAPPSPLPAPARSTSLVRHRSNSDVLPPHHRNHICLIAAPGKPPCRIQPRRSITVSPVTVARAPPSTSPCVS